jgi:sulfotransferase family protein
MQTKVFGIGISRTGTTSLTYALRILGYRAVHCPLSILSFNGGALALSPAVVANFDAFTDIPVARLYRELDAQFPGSKFILTVRPIERWLLSIRRMRRPFAVLKLLPKVRRLVRDFSGTTSLADERALKDGFNRHSKDVLDYFGDRLGKDLLVLDVSAGDAWDKLCGFLGQPKPAAPFPHYNRGYGTTLRNMGELIRYAWPIT